MKCSERVCGIVEGGSRHKKQGGGEGEGVGCLGYRWAASLDLEQSRDLAATISWGRLCHSGTVRGKNDICLSVSCIDVVLYLVRCEDCLVVFAGQVRGV